MVAHSVNPTWFSPPPPGPAPVPESGPPLGTPLAIFRALRGELGREVSPMAGPVLAVISTLGLLFLVLGLYVWLCVAVFAIF